MKFLKIRISKALKKTAVLLLISWLPLGFIGRSMTKHYWVETYRDSLREYAWTNIDERKQNLLILTGPMSFLFSISYIAIQDEPKWGLVLDFKSKKIPAREEYEEYQELKKKRFEDIRVEQSPVGKLNRTCPLFLSLKNL